MNTIEQIESQGITISLAGDKIKLEPLEKVTPAIVAEVKANKTQILDALNNRTPCYCCKGQSFWRNLDNPKEKWVCGTCHPPAINLQLVEWLQ